MGTCLCVRRIARQPNRFTGSSRTDGYRSGFIDWERHYGRRNLGVYDVSEQGKLTLLGSVPRRGATNKDTKDIELSRDGKYLYAVGSGERQISVFKIESNRLLTELPAGQSPVTLPTGQNITGLAAD